MTEARCAAVVGELSAYLDGELEAELADRVRRHLAGCPGCRGRYEREQALRERVRGRGVPEAPEDVRRRIRERLLEEDRGEGGGTASDA